MSMIKTDKYYYNENINEVTIMIIIKTRIEIRIFIIKIIEKIEIIIKTIIIIIKVSTFNNYKNNKN